MEESLKDEKKEREEELLHRVCEILSDDNTFVQDVHATEG